MATLRAYLVAVLAVVAIYTVVVVLRHGLGFVPILVDDIASLTWHGQFDMDYFGVAALVAAWIAWRHRFSAGGIAIAVVGFFIGSVVILPYMIWSALQADSIEDYLLGPERTKP